MEGSPTKVEEAAVGQKAGYKSWKKKYRKMRIVFDQKMQEGEDLHKREDKASSTVKRLAVENDRLLELILDINNSPQIPLDKRIDLSLQPSSESNSARVLPLDSQHAAQKELAMKHLEEMLNDIPHSSYSAAKESNLAFVGDLAVAEGESYPTSFLCADDIDNYIHDVDSSLDRDTHIPTLAPRAHPSSHPIQHPHLKNPTSVTNWLRKHAPKIFLQDGEAGHGDGEDGAEAGTTGHTGGRKTRGSRGERGGGRGRGKRGSLASRQAAAERERDRDRDRSGVDLDGSMDEDPDYGSTPVGRGGKRKRDDDPGYRPGGSAGRPVKKKRKSELDGTPTVRKSKKEAAAGTPSKDE